MLELKGVNTCYGSSQVLFEVDMEIRPGEMVALMGRNGMGKTTTIRSFMGLTPIRSGEIIFKEQSISGLPSFAIARMGIGLVPEGRQIFAGLTVEENLVATARPGKNQGKKSKAATKKLWTLKRIYALFPILEERRKNLGCQISGGEQQMLAMGRALMTNPDLLVLDEATEGLAPLIRDRIWECLDAIRESGMSILVVDKNITRVAGSCDKLYILEKGSVKWQGHPGSMDPNSPVIKASLGI